MKGSFRRGKKRSREEPGLICLSSLPSSVIRNCIGKFLAHLPKDYVALAQSSKRLWLYYCEIDPYVKCMRFAWNQLNQHVRDAYLLNSNIITCLFWLWQKETKDFVRGNCVTEYVCAGAKFGNLNIIQSFVQFAPRSGRLYADVISTLVRYGYEDYAITALENPSFLGFACSDELQLSRGDKAEIYFAGVRFVLRAPKFYHKSKEIILSIIEDTEVGEKEEALICFTLMAAVESENDVKADTFAFFWNQTPYIRHAKNLLFSLLADHTGKHALSIPWIASKFFVPFSKFSVEPDGVVQTIDFTEYMISIKRTRLLEPPGEVSCLMHIISQNGLATRLEGQFPVRWS